MKTQGELDAMYKEWALAKAEFDAVAAQAETLENYVVPVEVIEWATRVQDIQGEVVALKAAMEPLLVIWKKSMSEILPGIPDAVQIIPGVLPRDIWIAPVEILEIK